MKNESLHQPDRKPRFRIRDYEPEDLDDLKEIERRSFRVPWMDREWDEELGRITRVPRIAVNSKNRPVAFAIGTDYPDEKESKLYSLAVDRPYRNKGLGRLLLRDFIEGSRDHRVALDVLASNTQARKMYRSEGFRSAKRIQEENRRALIRMIREINEKNANRQPTPSQRPASS